MRSGCEPKGTVGGCNVGTLGSWAGTAQITTDAIAATQPIPTLSAMGLILLSARLGIAGLGHFGAKARRG